MALGKHVFCEKPLGCDAGRIQGKWSMRQRRAGVAHHGRLQLHPHPGQPAGACRSSHAGEIGDVIHITAEHVEDYLHSPRRLPASWRTRIATGTEAGALNDVGAAHRSMPACGWSGRSESLVADLNTVRADARRTGPHRARSGWRMTTRARCCCASPTARPARSSFSRVAAGRKMGYTYRITGTRGALAFDQENQNELWLVSIRIAAGWQRQGFQRLLDAGRRIPITRRLQPGRRATAPATTSRS
jgi:predicted dehydrogenase